MIRIWIAAVIVLGTVRLCANIPPSPDVYFSVKNNGECVKVMQSKTSYTCNNLPNKYNKVWVE